MVSLLSVAVFDIVFLWKECKGSTMMAPDKVLCGG